MSRADSKKTSTADQNQRFSFRLPSFLAPSRKTHATRGSNQPAATATPTTSPANTSSPAARVARPADKTRTAKRTQSKPPGRASQTSSPQPPGRASQTSTLQPQASKPDSRPPSQARAPNRSPVGQQTSSSATITPSQADPQSSTISTSAGRQTSSSATTAPSSTTSSSVGQQTSSSTTTSPSQADPQSSTISNSAGQQTSSSAATTPSSTTPSSAGQQTSSSTTTKPIQADRQSSTTSHSAGQQASSTTAATPLQEKSSFAATTLPQANERSSNTSSSVGQHASSESVNDSEMNTTDEEAKQHSSPSKTSRAVPQDSSHRGPSTSMEAPTSAFDREEPVLASNSASHGQRKASIQSDEKASLSKEPTLVTSTMSTQKEGPGTPIPTQSSNSSSMNHQMDPVAESDLKPEERKEVPDITQKTKEESKQDVNGVQSMESDSTEKIKEMQSNGVQPEQMLIDKQEAIEVKKMAAPSTPHHANQDEAAPTDLQPRNKNTTGDSHQQPAKFKEIPIHKEVKDNISTLPRTKTAGNSIFPTDEIPVSVITLAGENRGASMQLGSESSNRGRTLHIHRSYKLNRDEGPEAAIDGETSSKQTESEDRKTTQEGDDQPPERYINSNIQGINNSVLFRSSVSEKSPGVYVVHTRSSPKSIKSTDEKMRPETHKAKFTTTPSQKLTYEPTVRRRCLRGLLLESSDSDQDNPEKPRHHGCRVSCNADII